MNHDIITMDHGSGGGATARLIEELLLPAFENGYLSQLGDGAILNLTGPLVFSTDSFVIDPLFFPGGDIGKLAVCGTVNDLAMCGGTPKHLSLSFILEEGFPLEDLRRIVASIAQTAAACGVTIVTGDTKVVEKGRGDGIYINTSGIGTLSRPNLSPANLKPGDKVILSGTMGDHGTAVMLSRSGLLDGGGLRSDCQPLAELAAALYPLDGLRVLRDPTRGGVATTLNELIDGTSLSIELEEDALPIQPAVRSACEMLGLDPLYCANEGKLLAVVSPDAAETALAALKAFPGGENAAILGAVTARYPGKVILNTCLGGGRVLSRLTGAQLPRIC